MFQLKKSVVVRWGNVALKFIAGESFFQVAQLILGVLIVRFLSKDQYGYYTLGATLLIFITNLTGAGMNVGFRKIAGEIHSEPKEFRSLFASAVIERRRQSIPVLVISACVIVFLLCRQGAEISNALWLMVLIMLGIIPAIHRSTRVEALLVQGQWQFVQIQKYADVCIRLALIIGLQFTFGSLPAWEVFASVATAAWTSALIIDIGGRKWWNPRERPNEKYSAEFRRMARKVFPNEVFSGLQAQIGFLILGYSGSTQALAELGALTRLTAAFGMPTALMSNVIAPAFSRCQMPERVKRLYLLNLVAIGVFCSGLFAVVVAVPNLLLAILGDKYAGLERALVLSALLALVIFATSVILRLNSAKGWVDYLAKWNIPTTLTMFLAGYFIFDLDSLEGVLWFTILARLPSLFLQIADGLLGLTTLRR